MAFTHLIRRHLYLRIWLAAVGAVAVLTLAYGWAWRYTVAQNTQPLQPRELIVRNARGEVLGTDTATRRGRGEGLEFTVTLQNAEALRNGDVLHMELPPREGNKAAALGRRPPAMAAERGMGLLLRPFNVWWLLGLVSIAVALGLYPIVRRLTERLVALQRSVQRFGDGDLSARAPETGQDEVADLARRFNAAAARIEALVHSHKSLLANASHELRSPLTRIRMGMELMGPQASPAFRDEILRNIAELDQLVDEILLASRLDASEADVGTPESIDLIGLAAEECARVQAELDAFTTTTTTAAVHGVAKLLRRAVRNLLENARRYSAGDITVEVRHQAGVGTQPGRAILRVCDRGPGVPPAQRERIFEPFYRLPGASERDGGVGVGLGLALVRSIALRHGGTVHCEDRMGGGACFVLNLPLQATA